MGDLYSEYKSLISVFLSFAFHYFIIKEDQRL